MEPRPILLVKSPACGGAPMHVACENALLREGYLVLHTDNPGVLRLLAPCPFTQADVNFLRQMAIDWEDEAAASERTNGAAGVDPAIWRQNAEASRMNSRIAVSMAERMEGLLFPSPA